MGEQLAVRESSPFMPALEIEQAVSRYQTLVRFVKSAMRENTDFGTIPGTAKPTLYKPGAEKLLTLFGLSCRFVLQDKVEDWSGAAHEGEPLFYYLYRCCLFRGDFLIAEADGSCNSREGKYRWRQGERVCPNCGKGAVIKGKEEFGGGWLCFRKKDGCGSKWRDGAPEIEGQQVGRIPNEDIASLVNTIQKMAQKRAMIAATLIAVNASEFFTQDLEDVGIDPDAPAVPEEIIIEARARRGGGKWDRPDWSDLFFKEALSIEGGYYSHENHVKNALKQEGFASLKREQAEAMLTKLRAHAQARLSREGNGNGHAAEVAEIPF